MRGTVQCVRAAFYISNFVLYFASKLSATSLMRVSNAIGEFRDISEPRSGTGSHVAEKRQSKKSFCGSARPFGLATKRCWRTAPQNFSAHARTTFERCSWHRSARVLV
ncbi:hypothetical protein TRVL_08914 [Trypanosoma vivax]|nr:hypothetical protein TRVL_08914 [Trypanosoma vivax]